MSHLDLAGFRKTLQDERERLEREIGEIDHLDRDQTQVEEIGIGGSADMGTDTYQREMDEGIEIDLKATLNQVLHAIERLDEGSYGKCTRCGKPIAVDRLRALPYTPYCLECATVTEATA